MIISIGPGPQIARVSRSWRRSSRSPVLTLERVRICKRDGELLGRPAELPGTDEHGLALWQKLMVHASESARHDGHPLHRALVQRLRATGVSGATSLRGIWGFHGDHPPHGDRLLQLHRHVPTSRSSSTGPIGSGRRSRSSTSSPTERGLVTSEIVPATTALAEDGPAHGGLRLARHRF